MSKGNMFESVFEKPGQATTEPEAILEKPVQDDQPKEQPKSEGLFHLKDVPSEDRRPTTIIFTRNNLAFLKKLAIDQKITMSEIINRWLEGLQAEGEG